MKLTKILGILLFAAAMAAPPATMAQENACNSESLGQVSCQRATLCQCQYFTGGAITGAPDGYRWDCSAFRPRCESAVDTLSQAAHLAGPGDFSDEEGPGVSMIAGLTNGIASFRRALSDSSVRG